MLESSIEWCIEQINENFQLSADLDKYTFDLGGDALTFAKSVWDVAKGRVICHMHGSARQALAPHHVRFILDEFANMGVIPDADKKLSVMRSRNMSASIVLQSISQLEKNYKDTKETLIDNCDSLLFLGSKSNKTNKEIAERIGKATVHNTAVTESKGSSGSYSEADQIIGRYLIDPAEIGRLERDECLVLITGLPPFRSKKNDVTKHPHWSLISG